MNHNPLSVSGASIGIAVSVAYEYYNWRWRCYFLDQALRMNVTAFIAQRGKITTICGMQSHLGNCYFPYSVSVASEGPESQYFVPTGF